MENSCDPLNSFVYMASGVPSDNEDDAQEAVEATHSSDDDTPPAISVSAPGDNDDDLIFEMDGDETLAPGRPMQRNFSGGLFTLFGLQHSPNLRQSTHALIRDAREVGARNRDLINLPSNQLFAILIGCQGEGTPEQANVARLANAELELAIQRDPLAANAIRLLLGAGDNTYPNGMMEVDDPRWQKHFYQYYQDPALRELSKLACILALGNHDENIFTFEAATMFTHLTRGAEAGLVEVAHCYTEHPGDPAINISRRELYANPTISYRDLPKVNIPSLYDSWRIGNLRIVRLDSNTLLEDYTNLFKEKKTPWGTLSIYDFERIEGNPRTNQAAWLAENYPKFEAEGTTLILLQHQPFKDPGKRAYSNGMDGKLFFKDDATRRKACILLGLPQDCKDFALMHLSFHQLMRYNWFMLICAHVHNECVRNNVNDPGEPYKYWQLITGGGGGKAQYQKVFDDRNVGAFSDHGLMTMSCDVQNPADTMEIEMVTEDGMHLKFNRHSAQPIRENPHQDCVLRLRRIVLNACLDYQEQHQTTADPDELSALPAMISYLTDPNKTGFAANVIDLHRLAHKLPNHSANYSLYNVINKKLKEEDVLGRNTLQVLHEDVLSVQRLRELVLACCQRLQIYVAGEQGKSQGNFLDYRLRQIAGKVGLGLVKTEAKIETDIRIMQKIVNFLNQTDYHSLQKTLAHLQRLINELTDRHSEHSLFRDLRNTLMHRADFEFEEPLRSLSLSG